MARRRGKKIDFVHWTGFSGLFLAQAQGTVAATIAAAQHLPETLLRIRGEYLAFLDGTQTGMQFVTVGMGIIVVPEGTGTTVLWSPVSDMDAPWIWIANPHLAYEETVVDVLKINNIGMDRREIDSKAMRKVPQTSEVQFVVENATLGNAASVNVAVRGRFLTGT